MIFNLLTALTGGGGLEYESGTWSPSSDVTSDSIYFSNTHTESPSIVFVSVDAKRVSTNYSFTRWCAIDYSRFMGFSDGYEGSGLISCIAQTNSSNNYAYGRVYLTYGGDTNGGSNQADISYKSYVKPDRIIPHLKSSYMTSSSSFYWRSAKVYNWVAIWASNICE